MPSHLHFRALPAVILCTIFKAGCSVHIINRDPALLLAPPARYSETSATGNSPDALWWALFHDNNLDALMDTPPDDQYRVAAGTQFIDAGAPPFISVPAGLVFGRPDIRALWNEQVTADAEIDQAIPARSQKIILRGSLFDEGGGNPDGMTG
ncbi:hypothetical protein FCL47_12335 [Desulfopila sp. IMCC35006]|uniref:hypothetical protein n=1 Tax=Desulfopila sp. IMCC35006 TaxID=2569542 RepID=UPI0010ACBFE8|nr:hypothetical protein [Desulfopila sp. IMCC35006]TKB25877.1 hypothetical protein FCL47_12335 [Desulfopila sp. IMCC35006]